MLKVLGDLRVFIRQIKDSVITDGRIFRLHTVLTTILLLGCSLIISAKQYVGKPIECLVKGVPVELVNNYCWVSSTYTIPSLDDVPENVPYPGLSTDYDGYNPNRKYHSYYQWVCFALFFQGLLSYLPKWTWNRLENGLMSALVAGMTHHHLTIPNRLEKKRLLLNYLTDHIKFHQMYAVKYWCCELMCLANVIGQFYAMNVFLDGQFYNYGLRALFDDKSSQQLMPVMFPRLTKCLFRKYGPSGTIQLHDVLCVLPLNVINEKAYALIWFWFVFSGLYLTIFTIYRLMLIFRPSLRTRLIEPSNGRQQEVEDLCRKLYIGDWWVLHMLRKNLNVLLYRDVLMELVQKLDAGNEQNEEDELI